MNSFQLKIIACILMAIDHVGAIMFPDIDLYRIIGRLSFPIFAFLLTEGYVHTRNLKKYFIRLFIFAIIPQIPYSLAFGIDILNIFFTLFFGMLAILVDDKINNVYKKWGLILGIVAISELLHMDYGYYGIIMIFLFKKYKDNWKKLIITLILLNISIYPIWDLQVFSLGALPLIKMYNKKIGFMNKFVKYGFYSFYPVHILVIYLINEYVLKK